MLVGAKHDEMTFGQNGSVYTTATSDAIKPPTDRVFVVIQFLEDTTFDSSGGLVAETATKFINTEDAAGDLDAGSETGDEGSGGKQITNAVIFPKGFAITGRWTEIDLNSGSIIAYIG